MVALHDADIVVVKLSLLLLPEVWSLCRVNTDRSLTDTTKMSSIHWCTFSIRYLFSLRYVKRLKYHGLMCVQTRGAPLTY